MSRQPQNQPLSYKTVPGRHKTQKWQQAKTYDYSGDDWGGYDEYGDYEDEAPPPPQQHGYPPQPPQQYRDQAPPAPFATRANRQNSFDVGEERRAFSAGTVPPPGGFYGREGTSPARSAASSGGRSEERRSGTGRGRDFTNPESVPAPLNMGMRGSPGPSTAPPAGTHFPPRQSSMSRGSPAPDAVPNVARPVEKELPTPPFVRPSDIYRRMEAEKEKERQSQDSSRPSMDSIQRGDSNSPASAVSGTRAAAARPLSIVEEKSPQIPQGPVSSQSQSQSQEKQRDSSPSLPPIQQFSGFGSEMFPQSTSAASARQAPPLSTQQLSASSSLQATPTTTRAPPGSDPAAEILAERSHAQPVSSIGRQPDDLTHQPSEGYRSVVNKAFDRPDDQTKSVPPTSIPANRAISRDNSQSATSDYSGNISRSNTDSTSNISPIMSRVPSAATAQQRQQAQDRNVPGVSTIAEEPLSSSGHSRNVSNNAEIAGAAAAATAAIVPPGYRRSLDPPSSDNSPARTPGLESANGRRFSEGLSAEHISPHQHEPEPEPPAVPDQGVEMMPALEHTTAAETPAEESSAPTTGVRTGRARAGTDYSLREADLAHTVNLSPSPDKGESFSPVPEAEKAEEQRDLFMQTRPTGSADSNANFGGAAAAVGGMSGASGRSVSPTKGRVRDLADNFDADSRRNSQASIGSTKSSWSRFGGSEENLPLSREKEKDDEPLQPPRPVMGGREQSFRPQLPGGWVSYHGTPPATAESPAPARTEPVQEEKEDEITPTTRKYSAAEPPPDLTPTTKKWTAAPDTRIYSQEEYEYKLRQGSDAPDLSPADHSPSDGQGSSGSFVQRTKTAGEALGASLMGQMGLGHQTRDFAAPKPAPAPPVEINKDRLTSGEFGLMNAKQRPDLLRGETDESVATVATDMSESETEDEGLRRDILRSLDSPAEDRQRTQDALDAPDNMRRVERGEDARPAAEAVEMKDESPSKPAPLRSFLDQRFSWEKPEVGSKGILDTPTASTSTAVENGGVSAGSSEMFAPASAPAIAPVVHAPTPVLNVPPKEPEIVPEMPYERPRSRGLHIMNAGSDDEVDEMDESPQERRVAPTFGHSTLEPAGAEINTAQLQQQPSLLPVIGGPVSPITKSQENLHARSIADASKSGEDGGVMRELAPSPLSESGDRESDVGRFLPSYYTMDPPSLHTPKKAEQEGEDVGPYAPEAATATEKEVEEPEKEVRADRGGKDGPIPVTPPPPEPLTKDTTTAASPTSPTSKAKIPPFREILAIKTPESRIQTYDSTRRTFAEMDTGLSAWLSQMLDQHPEHANLPRNPTAAAAASGSWGKGHRSSPSIANRLALPRFNTGASNTNNNTTGVSSSSAAADGAAPEVPPKTPGGSTTTELQQRGKDLMKGAGVLGGKAQAGAKGLLAKGRSRFGTQRESRGGSGSGGGGKVVPTAPAPSPVPSADLPSNDANSAPTHIPHFHSSNDVRPALAPLSFPALLLEQPSHKSHSPSPSPRPGPSPLLKAAFPPPIAELESLRAPTPSHTPVSEAEHAGRPLSRTFVRLREKSRSLSRGISERKGGSRPQSLVLSPLSTDASSERLKDDVAAPRGDAGGGKDNAISPWQEPDDVDFAGLDGLRSITPLPERLGVLPSPGAETFSGLPWETSVDATSEDGLEPPRGQSIDAALVGTMRHDEELSLDPVVEARPGHERTESDMAVKEMSGQQSDAIAESTSETRPKNQRKVSDLATLPSRVKDSRDPEDTKIAGLQEEEDDASLGAMPLVVRTDKIPAEDRLHESTPVAVAYLPPASPPKTQDAEEDDNEDLYESTPVAEKQSWKHDDTIKDSEPQMKAGGDAHPITEAHATTEVHAVTGAHAFTGTGDLKNDVTSLQATESTGGQHASQHSSDKRSEVSSNNDFRDAKEGLNADNEIQTPSRRSSVSSLEYVRPGVAAFVPEEPATFSHAVPSASHVGLDVDATDYPYSEAQNRQQQSMSGQYNHHAARPMSYAPSGVDTGAVNQERGLASTFVSRNGFSKPLDGATISGPRNLSAIQGSERVEADADGPKSRRLSSFFRGRDLQSPTTIPAPVGPPPRLITDNYGLENLHHDAEDIPVDDFRARRQQVTSTEKTERRKSGIWETFKRSPNASTKDISRDSSLGRLNSLRDSNTAVAATNRSGESRNTLKKIPQRASSAAVQSEPKKKRASRLGSLFGRSSTTVRNFENPRKLTKAQVPGKEGLPSENSKTGYESYEAGRRQQIPDFQQRESVAYPSPTLPNVSLPNLNNKSYNDSTGLSSTPPEGWYAPQEDVAALHSTLLPRHQQQQAPRFRRIDSDKSVPESQYTGPTQVSRPVAASDEQNAGPVGSPSEQQSAQVYSPPLSPISSTYQSMAPRQPLFPNRNTPYDVHQRDGARSGWHHRSFSMTISSIQSGAGDNESGLVEETARSPAREYTDQQTPWAIRMPDDSARHSRAASWEQSDSRQISRLQVYVPSGSNRSDGGNPSLGTYRDPQVVPLTPRSTSSLMAHAPMYGDQPPRNLMGAYPSPPYSPDMRSYPGPPLNGTIPKRQPQRYYDQPRVDQWSPRVPPGALYNAQRQSSGGSAPLNHHRTRSGFSGRRDDPAVGEDALEMLDVDYPGQEWAPNRLD